METFQDLIQRIESRRRRLGISRHPAWYRGHSTSSFSLTPSIIRHKNGLKHERNLFAVFGTEGAELLEPNMTSWERLAIMQHYGVPTRLLDWTESLHTALFFATIHSLTWNVGEPCIWILNPFRVNKLAIGENIVFDSDDKVGIDYYEAVRDGGWPYEKPIALAAPWKNPRVKAQKGFFTFHGNDCGVLVFT